jgi:thiamine kinase-like enzyme
VLADLRPRVNALCGRMPRETGFLRKQLLRLEREAPVAPGEASFVHGDFGPANLLWRTGEIVVLDFDKCTRGDPAQDLGNLLAQMRRSTLRKPGVLPDFASMRSGILDAYQRWSPPDPGLARRVAWHEEATLLWKIHSLTFDRTRHPETEIIRQREAEAIRLLRELPALVESEETPSVMLAPDRHATWKTNAIS